jgi:tRNA G18 (ribose-2'-O)-methylase SpoU
MPIVRLRSLDDPRVTEYRSIRDPDLLRTRGVFVAEGRLVVTRLIELRRYRIRSLLLSDAALAAMRAIVDRISDDVAVYVCESFAFLDLTGLDIHRGCLALVERAALLNVLDVTSSARTIVILEGVANPDNVGGVFRCAAAFGVNAVVLSPSCCDPLYRKAVRTSMAATLRVPFARMADWPHGLNDLRAQGVVIAALTAQRPALCLDEVALRRPDRLALLIGSEGIGLSAEALRLANLRVRIPIAEAVDSLNVSVAAGIALSRLAAPLSGGPSVAGE